MMLWLFQIRFYHNRMIYHFNMKALNYFNQLEDRKEDVKWIDLNKDNFTFEELLKFADKFAQFHMDWVDEQKPNYYRMSNEDAKLFHQFKELKNKEIKIKELEKWIEDFRIKYFGLFSTD